MEKLFVVKSIKINAPAEVVWKTLTEAELTKEWIEEGWGKAGVEDMILSSDWKTGSEVMWKNKRGTVLAKGNVAAINPYKLLRFTVFDMNSTEKFTINPEDGITYELTEEGSHTTLMVRQGDFSVMKEGEEYYKKTDEIWERALPKVKELSETNKNVEEQPTCGRGLAQTSVLPARFSEVIAALAENLELHMETLDMKDPNAKLEYNAYQRLAREYRTIASRLMATAVDMYGYYDLPMARHDEEKLANPKIAEAFMNFTRLEEELILLLKKHLTTDKKILAEIQ